MSKDYHEKSTVSKTIKNIKRYYRRRKGIILAVLMIIIVVLVTVIFLQMKSKKTLATAPNLPVVEENEISENPLEGKVCVCFGDSITANMQPPNDYPTILAKETGMKVYNLGVGGTRMSVHPESDYGAFSFFHIADSIVTNDYKLQKKAKKSETISYIAETKYNALKSIDWSKVDYITICYGANDIKEWSNPMDDPNNPKSTDTFIGALRYSIERIQMEYPHIKIIIMTPLFRYWSDTGEYSDEQIIQDVPYTAWVDAVIQTALEYDLHCIDLYKTPGFNRSNHSYYYDDGIHPNKRGLKIVGEIIAEQMEAFYLEDLEDEED